MDWDEGDSMKKSVCIIRSNPVRPDSRVEKEAYAVHRQGYEVHILAWDRDSDHAPETDVLRVVDADIPITRLGYRATFGEGFKNIVPYLNFQMGMRRFLHKHPFDIVHACDFDTAFFSQGLVKRKKEKHVFDIFDFLSSDPKSFLQRMVKRAQIHLINRADATIICTEDRKRQIAGSNPKRLAVIHNTPMPEQIPVGEAAVEDDSDRKVRIVYVGILQDYRLLREIAMFFSAHPEIEWHVGGFGKYEDFFQEVSRKHDNVKFYGRLSYGETLALENRCDIMLAVYDPAIDNHKFAAPNKFYESLMLGKPVIMVKGTGMSEEVAKHDIGVLIDYSEKGFESGVCELIARKEEWPRMSAAMKLLYEERYHWKVMEARITELYASL